VDLAVDLEDRSVGREQGGVVIRAVVLIEPTLRPTYFSMSFWLVSRSYS